MALLRNPVPRDVRARLAGGPGGRTLAAGRLTDGWAVATTTGIAVVPDDGDVLRRAWSDVDGARLDPASAELTVTWVDGLPPTVLHLADDRDVSLPRTLHERVQQSVVHSETVRLPRGDVVRVALRRSPTGELFTQVIGPGAVDLTDPATAELVNAAEARVREAAGL